MYIWGIVWILSIIPPLIIAIWSFQPMGGLDFYISTNQRPQFWALNQWEASLQFLRFWLTYKIKLQSQQSDSHLSNQTAIWAIRLQSSYTVVWLWRLQSDCRDAVKLRRLYTNYWDCKHNWCNLTAMQEDCSLIAEIAVWMWRLPSGMSGTREIFWTKG